MEWQLAIILFGSKYFFNINEKLENTIKWYLKNKKWLAYTKKKIFSKKTGYKILNFFY